MRRNQHAWNLRTAAHLESDFYDVASFKAGGSSLRPLELAELGDVRGKSLLHLMCHFGMDTLSWARMGAEVTGADFSPDGRDREGPRACRRGRRRRDFRVCERLRPA
ncbi:class I SAM-dependent methyltransferase [Fodinicola feengrottensis]|uniref:hypothetical protein n=1 Tax=Fodinicola feengrottensis TaxID=435914 RepID=UPI0013D42ACA|nr:hypothetical protein [Fodinicola feengrottensis]